MAYNFNFPSHQPPFLSSLLESSSVSPFPLPFLIPSFSLPLPSSLPYIYCNIIDYIRLHMYDCMYYLLCMSKFV